jgi:hypothetical protein
LVQSSEGGSSEGRSNTTSRSGGRDSLNGQSAANLEGIVEVTAKNPLPNVVFVNIFLSQSDHNRSEPLSFLGVTVLG